MPFDNIKEIFLDENWTKHIINTEKNWKEADRFTDFCCSKNDPCDFHQVHDEVKQEHDWVMSDIRKFRIYKKI